MKILDYKHLFKKNVIFQPYDMSINVTNIQIQEFLNIKNVPVRKYKICLLFSDVETSDIYGSTGNPEFICFTYKNILFEHVKYIGDQNYNADTIREYIRKKF